MLKNTHTNKTSKTYQNTSLLHTSSLQVITESIIDDYNKTDTRSMYKQYTQYLILHLKASALVTKNYKITIQ